jgi:signal transduction histidine kinase
VQTMLEIKAKLAQNKGFHLTYRIIRKDGEIIWVEEFADSKNGQIAYIEGIMIDITQQIEADEAIKGRNMPKQQIKLNQNLANMSHEIRTPLNGIIGFLQTY